MPPEEMTEEQIELVKDPGKAEDFAAMDKMLGLDPEEETPVAEAEDGSDEVSTVDPPVEEEPKEEPESPDPEDSAETLLAGKYKTSEELERGYQELQSRLGEQGSELGDLRKTIDKLNENLEYEEPVQINQTTVDWLDEQVETNPSAAAVYALQNDPTGALYDRVMTSWFEMPGEARNAAEFVTAVATQRLKAEFEERLDTQTKPLNEQAEKAAMGQAWTQAAQAIPALKDPAMATAMLEVAKQAPELAAKIRTGTPEERVTGLRQLYLIARGEQAESLQDVTTETAAAEAESSRAAKRAGTVATQTTVADAETVDENEAWLVENFDRYAGNALAPRQ